MSQTKNRKKKYELIFRSTRPLTQEQREQFISKIKELMGDDLIVAIVDGIDRLEVLES